MLPALRVPLRRQMPKRGESCRGGGARPFCLATPEMVQLARQTCCLAERAPSIEIEDTVWVRSANVNLGTTQGRGSGEGFQEHRGQDVREAAYRDVFTAVLKPFPTAPSRQ